MRDGQRTFSNYYSISASDRFIGGQTAARQDFNKILSMLERDPKTGKIIEKIQIYTNIRGGVFGAGYTDVLLNLIKENAKEFDNPNSVIDFVYNMAPHQSWSIVEPEGVEGYSHSHDRDKFSGNDMKGVRAAFSSNEKVGGIVGAHATASFVKDVGTFLKAWQNSKGDSAKLIKDFVERMQRQGMKVTVN